MLLGLGRDRVTEWVQITYRLGRRNSQLAHSGVGGLHNIEMRGGVSRARRQLVNSARLQTGQKGPPVFIRTVLPEPSCPKVTKAKDRYRSLESCHFRAENMFSICSKRNQQNSTNNAKTINYLQFENYLQLFRNVEQVNENDRKIASRFPVWR